jgi:hypothetical protein
VRFLSVVAAVCLGLLFLGEHAPAQQASPTQQASPGQQASPAQGPVPAHAAAAEAATAPGAAASPSGEAAAKHAKRTACLKSAKEKKLVGADKASFLKACIAAP